MTPPSVAINATLGSVTFEPGPLWKLLLSAGAAFLPGEAALAATSLEKDDAHTLVAGFAAEALLKALLAFGGIREPELKKLGHNLETMWSTCASKGLLRSSGVPAWVVAVNVFHNNPFFIRYKTGGGLYSLPHKTEVHVGLLELQSEITGCIGASSSAA